MAEGRKTSSDIGWLPSPAESETVVGTTVQRVHTMELQWLLAVRNTGQDPKWMAEVEARKTEVVRTTMAVEVRTSEREVEVRTIEPEVEVRTTKVVEARTIERELSEVAHKMLTELWVEGRKTSMGLLVGRKFDWVFRSLVLSRRMDLLPLKQDYLHRHKDEEVVLAWESSLSS